MGQRPAVPHRRKDVRRRRPGQKPTRISFKCTPEEFAELTEREGVIPAPYMARNHWVSVLGFDVLPRAEMKRLIQDSYDMVAAKLPKKVKVQLDLV